MKKLSNVNIDNIQALPSPNEYNQQISITDETVSLSVKAVIQSTIF